MSASDGEVLVSKTEDVGPGLTVRRGHPLPSIVRSPLPNQRSWVLLALVSPLTRLCSNHRTPRWLLLKEAPY